MPKENSTGYDFVRLLPRWNGKPPQAKFIKRGYSKVWMEHQPGEPGFVAEHHALMAGIANKTLAKPGRRPLQGHIDEAARSVGAMARDYFASAPFLRNHRRTQRDARRYVEQVLRIVAPGECSDDPVALWEVPKLNKRRMGLVAQHVPDPVKPAGGGATSSKGAYIDNHVGAMRGMFNWAIRTGWQADPEDEATAVTFNPAADMEQLRPETDGWHTWTKREVAKFIERWPVGTMAYLALMLMTYTALRRSDVIRCGAGWLQSDGRHHFTEVKGKEKKPKHRAIKLRKAVMDAIAATPGARATDTYLSMENGEPFSPDYFSHRFKDWCVDAGLPHCSAHGVRKHVATEAGNKGASDLAIAELLGHTSTKNVGKYVKKVNRAPLMEMALDAAHGVDGDDHDTLQALVAKLGAKGTMALVKQIAAAGNGDD